MFKKRTDLLEKASLVPQEVVKGKLTIEKGWEKFNNILEEGNRYFDLNCIVNTKSDN